jgi:CheY-like chemotaxis protein
MREHVSFMNAKSEMVMPAIKEKMVPPGSRKILVADDDPAIRRVLLRLLVGENYRVVSAANGFEAIERAGATKVDLVLLDLNMPGKDGWETFEQLSRGNPLLPIVLITARTDQHDFAMAAGVAALLEKPLDFEKLFHTIYNLLTEPAEACLARYTGRSPMFRYAPPDTREALARLSYSGLSNWRVN